jgi:hypothetical protein
MTRFISLLLALLIALPVLAAKKKERTGTVTDMVYTDSEYDFSFTLTDNWSYKLRKAGDNFRLVLLQKNYAIPSDYQDAPDYTQVPRVTVWADTTSLDVVTFVDSLVSETFKSEQKKEIFKEFDIFNSGSSGSGGYRETPVPRKRTPMTISGERAILWNAQMKYRQDVTLSAASQSGKTVNGAYGGSIIGLRKGNQIVLFHLICEWSYFVPVQEELTAIVNTFTWVPPTKEEKK